MKKLLDELYKLQRSYEPDTAIALALYRIRMEAIGRGWLNIPEVNHPFTVGQVVLLRPWDDVKAVVRAVYTSVDDVKYECAWFTNDGTRHIEYFYGFELKDHDSKGKG